MELAAPVIKAVFALLSATAGLGDNSSNHACSRLSDSSSDGWKIAVQAGDRWR